MVNLHLLTSVINSGLVTIATSLAMTVKNSSDPHFLVWLTNWLVSWAIVCSFVYWCAPWISKKLRCKFLSL